MDSLGRTPKAGKWSEKVHLASLSEFLVTYEERGGCRPGGRVLVLEGDGDTDKLCASPGPVMDKDLTVVLTS